MQFSLCDGDVTFLKNCITISSKKIAKAKLSTEREKMNKI